MSQKKEISMRPLSQLPRKGETRCCKVISEEVFKCTNKIRTWGQQMSGQGQNCQRDFDTSEYSAS